jgi:hypothetical protein
MAISCIKYSSFYITVLNGLIEPLGRPAFVKVVNPDMYHGYPHFQLLAKYAQERGWNCIPVVHFAGSFNYRSYEDKSGIDTNPTSYNQNGTYIIEIAFIDTHDTDPIDLSNISMVDSLKVVLFWCSKW